MLKYISYSVFAVAVLNVDASTAFASASDVSENPQIVSFCAGSAASCVVFKDLGMKCFGVGPRWGVSRTVYGTSAATLGENLPFVDVGNNLNITQVSCGGFHTCMKFDDGKMKCLGSNGYGQAGAGSFGGLVGQASKQTGDSLPFVNIGSGLKALQIANGYQHTCVKVTNSLLKCFGSNEVGQLGLGSTITYGESASRMGDNLPYVNLGTNVAIDSIQSGSEARHNCAILSSPQEASQRMKCWGSNYQYQLGYGDTSNRGSNPNQMGDNLPLVDLGTESRVKQVSIGGRFTCTLLVNDDLKCFGFNHKGNLGLGSKNAVVGFTGDNLPPVSIGDGTISSLSAGDTHTCIVYDDNLTLKCVGENYVGQLGQGDAINRGDTQFTTFKLLPGVDLGTGNLQISSVYAGESHTCVVFIDSSVKCFGVNSSGECAAGTQSKVGTKKADMGANLKFAGLWNAPASEYGTPSPTSPRTSSPTSPQAPYILADDALTNSPTPSSSQSVFVGSTFAFFVILVSMICQF